MKIIAERNDDKFEYPITIYRLDMILRNNDIQKQNINLYTEIDNVSMNFIKPIQPEHFFSVEIELVFTSKLHSKVEVRVMDSDGECIALGMVSAVH